jgi:hypothetical protein
VRLRAAQGLLAAGEREAVPTLAALLTAPAEIAGRAEELLARLPSDKLPAPSTDRAAFRAAWEAWWRVHRDRLALPRDDPDRFLFDRGRQASACARLFLDALLRTDAAACRRLCDAPFVLFDTLRYDKPEQLDDFIKEIVASTREERFTYALGEVRTGEEFARRHATSRTPLDPADLRRLHAVYVLVTKKDGGKEHAFVLVRTSNGPVRIVGVGVGNGPGGK